MRLLPWVLLVGLFLPNVGLLRPTAYGDLSISDYLILPYIGVCSAYFLLHRARPHRKTAIQHSWAIAKSLALFFVAWALLGTFSEGMRFDYSGYYEQAFGLLKLVKFFLFSVAGLLTARLVQDERELNRFLWALLVGGVVTSLTLPFTTTTMGFEKPTSDALHGFGNLNGVSVEVAILITFLSVARVSGWGGRVWKMAVPYGLVAMAYGFVFSHGRGGWIAALAGLIWFIVRRGKTRRKYALVVCVVLIILAAYEKMPQFRYEVDRTVSSPSGQDISGEDRVFGIDQAGRPKYWRREAAKLVDNPFLGRGYFNRFPGSGLDWDGSHNFFIQMFLETGIPGGLSILGMFLILWRQSRREKLLPVEISITVAFVAGMSGEYFYGGMPLFALAACASLVWAKYPVQAIAGKWPERPQLRRKLGAGGLAAPILPVP